MLLDETEVASADHYENLKNNASCVGLQINKDKTKIMHINYRRVGPPPKALEGLEIVEDFKYLGARISSSLSDFRQRRGIAWSNFWKLQTIWRSAYISLQLKLRLFDSLILSILLYGAESWTLITIIKNQLNSFATSCYRIMLNIKRTDRLRNERVLEICNRRNLADEVTKQQLRTLGHWLRKQGSTISKYALFNTNKGKNRRGRPRHTYVKLIQQTTGLTLDEMKERAMDRIEWRRVVGRFDLQAPG